MFRDFLKKNIPFAKAIYKTFYLKLFSDKTQAGEARALKKLLKKDSPPYLVDIGAHDGTSISNSSFFIAKGWKGILIEPRPEPYKNTIIIITSDV